MIATPGVTHCKKCGCPLEMQQFVFCDKCERERRREELIEVSKEVNWWSNDISAEEFESNFQALINTYTPKELLDELIECGLEIKDKEEN